MKTSKLWPALLLIIAYAAGYMHAQSSAEKKAGELLEATDKAEKIRADKAKEITDELYEKYKEALSIEPVTVERVVTKRLYIKSDCDVQASQDGQVDNGHASGIVRLGEEADRSVKQVIREAEADYARVKNQLLACIAASDQR